MKFKLLFGILIIISCSKESFDNFSFNNQSFNGELKWIKKFGGSSDDKASDIIETSDGNIAIIGSSSSLDGSIVDKNTNEFDVLYSKNEIGSEIFKRMFKMNEPKLILKFLEEKTNIYEELKIMSTFPIKIFLKSLFKKIFKKI